MADHCRFFLGGRTLSDEHAWGDMLARFWADFEKIESGHPVFRDKTPTQRKSCLPLCFHGGEGRGLGKVPLLVLSYQELIPFTGEQNLNIAPYLG